MGRLGRRGWLVAGRSWMGHFDGALILSALKHLGHEKLTLRKADGTTLAFEGHVQPELIVVDGVNIPFQEENLVIRQLGNGVMEHYRIEKATQYAGISGMPPHYQLKVRKLTAAEAAQLQPKKASIDMNDALIDIFVSHSHRDVPKHLFRSPFNDLAMGRGLSVVPCK